jgi:hypothetical protein
MRTKAFDSVLKAFKSIDLKIAIGCIIPIAYLFPRIFLCSCVFMLGLLAGLVLQEGVVDEKGGFGLLMAYQEERIVKSNNVQLKAPVFDAGKLPMTLSEDLDVALNEFIGYTVRDFINRWYNNVNTSGSQEFPEIVHQGIYSAFVRLGYLAKRLNPTDMILLVMSTVIIHVVNF